jgi:hypothetical protein
VNAWGSGVTSTREAARVRPSWGAWARSLSTRQRRLVAGAVAVYVVGAGMIGWRLAAPEPSQIPPPTPMTLMTEVQALFDEEEIRGGGGLRGTERSYQRFTVGDDGLLVAESWYAGQETPATVPAYPRPGLTDEQRHERDLAFARGEDAYEQWRQERGLDEPLVARERGTIYADLEVECVRVLLSGHDVPEPDPDALAELVAVTEQRVAWWLERPASGGPCEQRGWYGDE